MAFYLFVLSVYYFYDLKHFITLSNYSLVRKRKKNLQKKKRGCQMPTFAIQSKIKIKGISDRWQSTDTSTQVVKAAGWQECIVIYLFRLGYSLRDMSNSTTGQLSLLSLGPGWISYIFMLSEVYWLVSTWSKSFKRSDIADKKCPMCTSLFHLSETDSHSSVPGHQFISVRSASLSFPPLM